MAKNAKNAKVKISDAALLGAFAAATVVLTVTQTADLAIATSWPNNPYSPLWFALNPFGDTQLLYRLWLAMIQGVSFFLMIRCVKAAQLPFKVAFVQVMVQLIWVFLHWDENITVTAFAWAAYLAWPFALLAVQKLPIGWSWNLQDAHVKCVTLCYNYHGGPPPEVGLILLLDRDILHWFTYILIIFAVAYPLWQRRKVNKIYKVPDFPDGPCCEAGDKCDGSCNLT